ncbi:MAG: redoxin domain-containing protein [Deltaproteobacteria bacterium]|nr:redoxin domain-containing protein [Deltaproteobacteria bacterium]
MAARRLIITVLAITLFIGLLAYGFKRDPRYIESPLIGRQAPAFTLTLFDGRSLSLSDLKGKVVFLNFWASWCPPCRDEARDIEASWQRFKNQDIVFVGVNIQDKEPNALEFISEFGITFPNGRDNKGKVSVDYGVWGIPETFFIDGEGRITYKHVGSLGWPVISAKLEEARRKVVSASEGRGAYQPIR